MTAGTQRCPKCKRIVAVGRMSWTHDRYGIPWRKVCDDCWGNEQADIGRWQFDPADAGEQLDEED